MSRWLTLQCKRVLYVDKGLNTILCDRMPSPVTIVVNMSLASIAELLDQIETGPENSREEVSPSGRSPQRDCKPQRTVRRSEAKPSASRSLLFFAAVGHRARTKQAHALKAISSWVVGPTRRRPLLRSLAPSNVTLVGNLGDEQDAKAQTTPRRTRDVNCSERQ